MKVLGAVLFVSMTSWIGFDMSFQLSKRTKQIRQLIQSLHILEAEMSYSQSTLQQIFEVISGKIPYPIGYFYELLEEELQEVVPDFLDIWKQQLQHLKSISALKQNELDILEQFGRTLGQYTFIEQQKHIVLATQQLQSELEEAYEQQLKYGKVMKTLGVLIGILIVLLLI